MNKYLLFTYDKYYPSGGIDDLKGSYSTIEECENNIDKEMYHIVLRDTFEIVKTNDKYLLRDKNN